MSCLESLFLPALCITNPPQENFGDLEVRLEAKTEKESHTPLGEAGLGRASFNEFFIRDLKSLLVKRWIIMCTFNAGILLHLQQLFGRRVGFANQFMA